MKNNGINGLAIVLTAFISMTAGALLMQYKYNSSITFGKKYPVVIETYDFIKKEGEQLPESEEEEQIDSFMRLYDDEYTFYKETDYNSLEYVLGSVNRSPTACGCGFSVGYDKKDGLYFSEIKTDMPAYLQGLRTGDVLISIDGDDGGDYSAAENLKGKEGSTVELIIDRNGNEKQIVLKRFSDSEASKGLEHKMYGNTLYVKYSTFDEFNISELKNILSDADYDSVALDLRENLGGPTDVAMDVADLFVDRAEVKMTSYSGGTEVYATEDGAVTDAPIAVLVNKNSASSSEIVASLLKQYANAVIVGQQTYGKGVYQINLPFKGGTIQYTAGSYTAGDWPCWQGVGIAPDVEVEMDPSLIGTDEDVQLQKALELLG